MMADKATVLIIKAAIAIKVSITLLNCCFLLLDVSETENTIMAITASSKRLNINRNSLSLYGSLAEKGRLIKNMINMIKTKGLKMLAMMGAILLVMIAW